MLSGRVCCACFSGASAGKAVDVEAGEEVGLPKDSSALVNAFGASQLHTALCVRTLLPNATIALSSSIYCADVCVGGCAGKMCPQKDIVSFNFFACGSCRTIRVPQA